MIIINVLPTVESQKQTCRSILVPLLQMEKKKTNSFWVCGSVIYRAIMRQIFDCSVCVCWTPVD